MALSAGHNLGSYRIEKFLTSGGMGDVYLASHERLKRHVAIKVLGDSISGDPVAVQRFRREARAASTLSHPHICTLYDFCQQDGLSYLVLEYLEGVTLEARLKKRRPGLADAMRIGAEVAEALDHAHTRGFVHRDLKPGNVMLTQEHGAKVLDFGLVARSPAPFAPASGPAHGKEAATADLTVEGTLVGTLPYMSPEQIQGSAVDARTDIYALGALLYEMITGHRAFEGRSPMELAVAIVHAEPIPVGERAPDTPDLLVRLVQRCMARNPEDRWQSARDVAAELRWLSATRRPLAPRAAPPNRRNRLLLATGMAGVLVAGLLGGLLVSNSRTGDDAAAAGLASLIIPAPAGVTFTESSRSIPTLSPDGTKLLFVGTDSYGRAQVYIHDLAEAESVVVPRTEGAALPFWAPDSRSIGFLAGGRLMVLAAGGGPPVERAAASLEGRGASWSRDDVLVYSPGPRTGVFTVPAAGGPAREVTVPDRDRGEIGHLWPRFLPDGRHFLYFVSSDVDSVRGIYVASLDGSRREHLVTTASSAVFGSDQLLYVRGNALLAQPFDATNLRLAGAPRMLDESVLVTPTYAGGFSISETGRLAYWSGSTKDVTRLLWFDRFGRRLDSIGTAGQQRNVALSRDGRFIANEQFRDSDGDIVITDVATGQMRRLASPSTQERNPVWSPDGRSIAFVAEHSSGWAIYRHELESARARVRLLHSETDLMTTDWSPDGSMLLYANRRANGNYDLYTLELRPGSRPQPLFASNAHEVNGRFSPSGRWIAYGSSESGALEIYIQPFPLTGLKCQISDGGGYDPHWGADDGEIHYLSRAGELMAVTLAGSGRCPTDAPRLLFRTPVQTPGSARNHYALSPGTGAFVINAAASDPGRWTIRIILDWPAALSRQ